MGFRNGRIRNDNEADLSMRVFIIKLLKSNGVYAAKLDFDYGISKTFYGSISISKYLLK